MEKIMKYNYGNIDRDRPIIMELAPNGGFAIYQEERNFRPTLLGAWSSFDDMVKDLSEEFSAKIEKPQIYFSQRWYTWDRNKRVTAPFSPETRIDVSLDSGNIVTGCRVGTYNWMDPDKPGVSGFRLP